MPGEKEKKPRNPSGSIFKRRVTKNGKKITVYDVRKRHRNADGIYKDKNKRCYSYAEALIELGNLPAAIESATPIDVPGQVHTFFELTDYYVKEYCIPAVIVGDQQVAGFRQDPSTIKAFVTGYKEFFHDVPLRSITYERIRAFAVHLATTPIKRPNAKTVSTKLPAPATVNRKLAYLRRVFNIGKRLRWLDVNPFNEGEPLIKAKLETPRQRILTYKEEWRLLAACRDKDAETVTWRGREVKYERDNQRPHLYLIITLAIDTGMRAKEIFSLKRRDINLREQIIDLPAVRTKALKRRIIVISERLEQALTEYFDLHSFSPNDLIFFGQKSCDTAFETAVEKAGITDLTFHDLRHTATSWMDEAGVSQPAKQNMIGHADDRTHQDYHNPSVDILNSIREKIDAHRRKREQYKGEMAHFPLTDIDIDQKKPF